MQTRQSEHFEARNNFDMKLKSLFIAVCASVAGVGGAFAQEDVPDILTDYVWNRGFDSDTLSDASRVLVLSEDSMPTGRFKRPLEFTKQELNKIADPRVRDMYWYALNDSTDEERYRKVHYAFNRKEDNWAFELGGGAQTVFMQRMNGEFTLGPQFELGFKKDLHPYWAARGTLQVSKYHHFLTSVHESTFIANWEDRPTTNTGGYTGEEWRQKVTYSSFVARADIMLNILNMKAGRELLYNPFDFFFYAGAGGAYSAHELGTRDGSCFVPFWHMGFQTYANFTQRFSLYLNLNASWQGDDLEGYSEQNSTYKLSAMLGFGYKFSRVIHFSRLGYDDTELRQMLNDAYEEGDQLATYIQNTKKDTVVNLPADLIEAAFFQIDRIELAHSYVLNLGFYADMIKAHPTQKFLVRGFADVEVGSKKRNEWLAQKRAEVVFDVLTKTYNVNPDQLVVDAGQLEIDLPFLRDDGHHRFNRCTIVCPLSDQYQNVVRETEFDDKSELMDGRVRSNIEKRY